MNISQYKEKKARGLVTIAKVGPSFIMVGKRFNSETGAEMDPEVYPIKTESLDRTIAELESQLASAKELRAELAQLSAT